MACVPSSFTQAVSTLASVQHLILEPHAADNLAAYPTDIDILVPVAEGGGAFDDSNVTALVAEPVGAALPAMLAPVTRILRVMPLLLVAESRAGAVLFRFLLL